MTPWRAVWLCATLLIAMSLADPDLLKRPSRPSQFRSESEVRKYIEELKEYIRNDASPRYGKRYAPPTLTEFFPGFYRGSNAKQTLQNIYHSEGYEKQK